MRAYAPLAEFRNVEARLLDLALKRDVAASVLDHQGKLDALERELRGCYPRNEAVAARFDELNKHLEDSYTAK